MKEGYEAKHQRHPAPLIAGQPLTQGSARNLADDVVHGTPWLDANRLQEAKATLEIPV